MKEKSFTHPWFTHGDADGFFGLFIDNLLQLMLVIVLCRYAAGLPADFVSCRILPGAALSILVGNVFFTWQARRLAEKERRRTVTALPFGINTVSLLAFVFFVMGPVYNETGNSDLAWRVGLAACFLSGLIETAGAFVGRWIKRHTPRAALLSGLGGVALSFMALGFSFQIFANPSMALVPAFLILFFYAGRVRLPGRIPSGLFAVGLGVGATWIFRKMGLEAPPVYSGSAALAFHPPLPAFGALASIFFHPSGWKFASIVLPMGFFNVIGSIQNLESAEAVGDKFDPKESLLMNGLASLAAASFGSPFPTSIYIGHPGWKSMGARSGYSLVNGVVIALLCLTGGISLMLKFVPIEATLGFLLWVGLVMASHAFSESDKNHALAVAAGFIPPLAAWALHVIETTLRVAGSNLYEAIDRFQGELFLNGILSLYQGFLLTSIIISAVLAHVIDRKFKKAAVWCFIASLLSCVGLIHAYRLTPSGLENYFGWMAAPWFTLAYGSLGVFLLMLQHAPRLKE